MIAFYTRIYQLGGHEHQIEIFGAYTKQQGCIALKHTFANRRATEVIKKAKPYLTKQQVTALKKNMSGSKFDGAYDETGKYLGIYI